MFLGHLLCRLHHMGFYRPSLIRLIIFVVIVHVQEEERYADFLGQEFCLGLAEIDNGTTKRVYLSTKLACTKMRISKKFKGKNSGKEVFLKRTTKPDGLEYSTLEIAGHKQKHADLERSFIKSVLKSELKSLINVRNHLYLMDICRSVLINSEISCLFFSKCGRRILVHRPHLLARTLLMLAVNSRTRIMQALNCSMPLPL